ncbi:DUF6075 family protein [Dorea sp. AGR2135]|uniref:DUF6075 family protein n=1 Tax=Dorea sp. AGR2135 TaxID=1280669 RepID=UPI00041CDF0A|nr:DUF6075 family protein [Dorea sp. AGR2135]
MSEIRFSSKEHEKFFYQMLAKCGKHDSYYSSFFYCVGISEDTRNHVDRMFDFKERLIKPEALHEGWQTGGSARLTRLAFNLWNGYVEKGEESLSTPWGCCGVPSNNAIIQSIYGTGSSGHPRGNGRNNPTCGNRLY